MADRCEGAATTRTRSYSSEEKTSCETPKEDPEQARVREEREAAARRDAWARGEGERGMSKNATSTYGATPPVSNGPTLQERKAAETKKYDRPLEDDPVGNAIPGLVAGGIVAGAEAAAAGGAKAIAGHVAKHTAVHVAADVIEHEAPHVAHAAASTMKTGPDAAAPRGASKQSSPSSTPSGGQSGVGGTCAPAKEPNQSTAPAPALRIPYVIQG
jgi:hypothetical protein